MKTTFFTIETTTCHCFGIEGWSFIGHEEVKWFESSPKT
jgi:hypothetical protein